MDIKEKLRNLKLVLDVLRGKEDAQQRYSFLLSPTNLKTSSRLTTSQLDFVADSFYLNKWFPEFEPLLDLAKEVAGVSPSLKGKRIEELIKFEAASKPQTAPSQLGIFSTVKEKVRKKKEKEAD